ncbi:MAG: DUF4263 domain-containing protein [Deltaproteobacteria bacterium]|nr:DUF4263 domain-containing protein [Deltaproteobacteria bacterium]
MPSNQKPTEDEIIQNSKTDVLYTTDFQDGKYFQVVFEDETGFGIQIATRTMFKVLYIKNKADLTSFEIVKCTKKSDKAEFEDKQKVTLSQFNFSQLIAFLKLISKLDLKGITEGKISLSNDELGELDDETKKKIKTLLSKNDGADLIQELLNNGNLTTKDIVNTGYRKEQLEIFRKLLEENYLDDYKNIEAQKYSKQNEPPITAQSKNEKVWQYFFEQNQWIFGYGLDYRFMGILQREFAASISEADGSNTVFADYLLGDKKFTTFVEIKLPDTNIFGQSKNRSGSWCLSSDLIDAVSQILEQKASGTIKLEKEQHDSSGNKITQKSYDSKTVLIMGNWKETKECNDLEKKIKEKTFELFRRDSRNIEIITYDEIYERAKYIVEQ